MKQKIFTLLLAIGVLTAFQANALQRQKVRIHADTSGWTAGGVAVDSVFPFFKPAGLERGLSGSSDNRLVVGMDTIEYDFNKTNFAFKFFRPGAQASSPLVLSENSDAKSFAIFSFERIWNETGGKATGVGKLVTNTTETKEGYLVSIPAGYLSPTSDTIKDFSLVGVGENSPLSFKKFNEFVFHGDSVPYAPFWAYQYIKDYGADSLRPGRLYQTGSFPYFQIYDSVYAVTRDSMGLIDSTANRPSNWGNIGGTKTKNPNDSLVYTWLNIKLSGDSALVLFDTIIRLDSIRSFADTLETKPSWFTWNEVTWGDQGSKTWKGIDTTSLDTGAIHEFRDSMRVYLKKDVGGYLSFTVRKDSSDNIYSDSEWTNGAPTKFKINNDSCFYYIDTMFFEILPSIIDGLVTNKLGWTMDSLFNPETNHFKRYLHKDSNWHPLYVTLEDVRVTLPPMKKDTAQYVGWEWVKENRYNLSAAVQTIVDGTESGISLGSGEKATFKFEQADSIKSSGKFAKTYNMKSGQTGPTFQNNGKIELFRIKNDVGNYLTVLDTTEFTDVRSDTFTVATNTQLGWQGIIPTDTIDCARQMFAIVHNYADTTTTFLPVASRKWVLEGDIAKYVTADTLFFNPGIGLNLPTSSDTVDFSETWYLTKKAQLDSPTDYKLVIADSASKTERIWFDLKSTLKEWTTGSTYVSIKKGSLYYHADSTLVNVSHINNDIKAHWKINKDGNDAWKFTPVVDTIYGTGQDKFFKGEPVFAFKAKVIEGDSILLVDKAYERVLDTVSIGSIDPEDFSLFKNLDDITDTTVIIVSGSKYIALGEPMGDTIVAVAVDTTGTKNPVKVTKSNVKYLVDGLYPIHHYIFSIEKGSKKYFLNAGDSIVRWVSLDSVKKDDNAYASYKFALPNFVDDGVYLQTLDTGKTAGPRVIKFVSDSSKFESVDVNAQASASPREGIYSAIDFYNTSKNSSISKWRFIETEEPNGSVPGEDEDLVWLSRNDLDFEGNMEKGLFSTTDSKYIGYKTEGDVKYGVLRTTTADSLILKFNGLIAGDTVETFNIVSAGLCLSVSNEDKAIFIDTATAQASTLSSSFAFCKKVGESQFAIVSAAGIKDSLRFLNVSAGDNLIFTAERKLGFTWNGRTFTGIKAITASGKIYGVAGGVKVLGATGAVAIYTIDGRLVTKKTVTSPNQTIAVPAGIYVVRNGAEATKVVVK